MAWNPIFDQFWIFRLVARNAKRNLSILIFCLILVRWGCTCEKKIALSLKRHLFPHGDRVKTLAQGFLDSIFGTAPISNMFSKFSRERGNRALVIVL